MGPSGALLFWGKENTSAPTEKANDVFAQIFHYHLWLMGTCLPRSLKNQSKEWKIEESLITIKEWMYFSNIFISIPSDAPLFFNNLMKTINFTIWDYYAKSALAFSAA